MATETSDSNKIQLLFKEFTGVVNAKQAEPFPLEEYAFKDYILNENILAQDIPDSLPNGWRSSQLDASNSIANDSITNLSSIGFPQLSFYKKKTLTQATFGSVKTWYVDDGQGGSDLKNAISFKFDPINNSYNYAVYLSFPGSVYSPLNMYSNPSFWLFDFKSGFLEFYGEEDDINGVNGTGIDLNANPPVISFIKYVGNTGGGGGTGNDASFNNIDISGNLSLQNNNLMQSVTIEPWTAPTIQGTYYIIATVPESGANALGYFTIQLQEPYYQQVSFYAGVMENKNSVIKVISNSNQDIVPNSKIGFENLKIILFNQVYYLTTTFKRDIVGEPIGLLKIILTNNNSNGKDQVNLDRFWTLKDNPQDDWGVLGPIPDAPWGPQPNLPTAQITVPLANLNTIFGGNAHGISSQPEYFQNHIVMGPSGNIVANDGTGTIDICGNLFVDRDASFNSNVFVRSNIDVSNNVNIQNNLIVGRDLTVRRDMYGNGTFKLDEYLTVDGSGNFGGVVTTVGNTKLVEYIRRNTPSTSKGTNPDTAPSEWFTIAQVDSSSRNTVSSGLFQIIDKTPSIKQILSVIVTFYEGSGEKAAINVISNNWVLPGVSNAPTPPYIRQIRVYEISDIIYIQLDRFGYGSSGSDTTNMDIRLYNNTNANLESGSIESADWVLRGNIAEPVGSGTSHALVNLRQGINSSGTASNNPTRSNLVTNSYSYMAGGAKIGNTLDMSSNNIENTNEIIGNNGSIDFNSTSPNGLEINGDQTLILKNSTAGNTINYNNDTLDFQLTNTIEKLTGINQTVGDITIGNQNNLVTIDASQVEIKSKGGGPPNGDIILNNSGGARGSIIFKNGNPAKGDIRFNASNLIGFDLSNNKLRVDEMEPSTSSSISFNNSDVSGISNVTTDINFNAKTNMYNDTSVNISSNLTSTGDFGFDTSNKIWTYNDGGTNYILANNKRVWFSTSNLPISSYNSGGAPTGISQFSGGFKIIPSEIVNYSMYQDYRNGVGGITDDFTDFGTGFLKYIEVQNDGIIRGGGSKFNNIYITDTQISPTQEEFLVKLNIKPSGGSWGTAQTLQIFPILVNSTGIKDLNGANFTSNISVNSGDLLRIELVFSPSNGAKFIFGQNKIGTATYPETSAGLIATGPRAMFWLDIIEYIPQLP